MNVSIAMATYNGDRYLREQLQSISNQTRLPDELVLCDDGSTDDTLAIAEEFARQAAFNVRIYRNNIRLGFKENFSRAIGLCTGDLIFLSDQDDVWFSNKIERVKEAFKSNPSAWVVVNNAEITNDVLKGSGLTVAGQLLSAGVSVDELLLGCCMAFRSQFKQIVFPIPKAEIGHDSWINTLGKTLNFRLYMPEVLQYFRRHASNVSNNTAAVMGSVRRASRWHMTKQIMSPGNLRTDPIVACDRRLAHARTLRDRLSDHADFLSANMISSSAVYGAINGLDIECTRNEMRKLILSKSFVPRLYSAFDFYRSGGYEQFEGWKSLAKDVLR